MSHIACGYCKKVVISSTMTINQPPSFKFECPWCGAANQSEAQTLHGALSAHFAAWAAMMAGMQNSIKPETDTAAVERLIEETRPK